MYSYLIKWSIFSTGDEFNTQNIEILPSILEEGPNTILTSEMAPVTPEVSEEQIRIKKEQERANCFGFDDSDEEVWSQLSQW